MDAHKADNEKTSTEKHDPEKTKGCPVSFLTQERGELGGVCGAEPDPDEEYV